MTSYSPFRRPSIALIALVGLVLQLGPETLRADTATAGEDPVYAPLVVARGASSVRHEAVTVGDLNLSTEAGLATAKRRIVSAARRVCQGADVRLTLAVSYEAHCQASARAGAMAQVDAIMARRKTAAL